MIVNIELAERARDFITRYPERHDQGTWWSDADLDPSKHCGTTACIAGWVIVAQGRTLAELIDATMDPAWEAQEALGLDDDEAADLFYNFDNESALERFDELIAEAKVAANERVIKA